MASWKVRPSRFFVVPGGPEPRGALAVPRSTAKAMVGHRTESSYRRYAIVDEVMLREGATISAHSDDK
jgi:hypothetical protein